MSRKLRLTCRPRVSVSVTKHKGGHPREPSSNTLLRFRRIPGDGGQEPSIGRLDEIVQMPRMAVANCSNSTSERFTTAVRSATDSLTFLPGLALNTLVLRNRSMLTTVST